MGILSGPAIIAAVECGDIVISPFVREHLGPNSYDLTLDEKLLVYQDEVLDPRRDNEIGEIRIGPMGFRLDPGTLYLASTREVAGSDRYVPCIEGRSSMARLGISIHDAGFGDHGFKARWTLEITVVHPVIIYEGMRVGQVYFHDLIGERSPYNGKYASSDGVVSSRSHLDFG